MNKKDKIKELNKSIKEKEAQLKKLSQHIEKSNICSDLYDKVILEKAELKKELDDLSKNNLVENLKNLLPHKKTLICDYFKK